MNKLLTITLTSSLNLSNLLPALMLVVHLLLLKNFRPNEMSGLDPVVFLANTAKVILTMNLWSQVGLCTGATGMVRHIVYDNNRQPPDLPVAVIVEFDN